MLRVIIPSDFTTVSGQVQSWSGKVFSRSLWIDVEPQGELFALVVRGEDKVMFSAAATKPSTSSDPANVKEKIAACFFNDETDAPRPFTVAIFADRAEADHAAAQLIAWYDDETAAPDVEPITGAALDALPAVLALSLFNYTDGAELDRNYTGSLTALFSAIGHWHLRIGALGNDARAILPILVTVFGPTAIAAMRRPGSLCSYAEHLSGAWKKRQPKKVDPAKDLRDAASQIVEAMKNDDMRAILQRAADENGVTIETLIAMSRIAQAVKAA